MSAPTTAEVLKLIAAIRSAERDVTRARSAEDAAEVARQVARLKDCLRWILPLAEERDAHAAEAAHRGELLAAERERYIQLQATLDAERRASMERSVTHMDEVARLQAALAEAREAAAYWMESAKDWRERR